MDWRKKGHLQEQFHALFFLPHQASATVWAALGAELGEAPQQTGVFPFLSISFPFSAQSRPLQTLKPNPRMVLRVAPGARHCPPPSQVT